MGHLIASLKNQGVVQVANICNSATVYELTSFWLNLSADWGNYFDMNNTHIMVVFNSLSQGVWPPEEGRFWPGYKQKTAKGNLIWKTERVFETSRGCFYTIRLQETPSVDEHVFYPKHGVLEEYKSAIKSFEEGANRLIEQFFPGHRATFSSLTYIAGSAFLPLHTDGENSLNTARIVQVLDNNRDHVIFVNQKRYNFKSEDSYLFNAYLPHEIKPSLGHRLTISSCIMQNE